MRRVIIERSAAAGARWRAGIRGAGERIDPGEVGRTYQGNRGAGKGCEPTGGVSGDRDHPDG